MCGIKINIEIEIKVKVANLDEAREKIKKVGKLVKKIRQIDDYYTPAHINFFAEKPVLRYMRTRKEGDKFSVEFHQASRNKEGQHEYAEEYETYVNDEEVMRKILELMDIKKVVTIDKEREYYDCGKFEVVLDNVKELGSFIEVEAKYEGDGLKVKEECLNFLREIGIKFDKQIKAGYSEIMLDKLGGA